MSVKFSKDITVSGKQIKKLKAENAELKEKLAFFEKRCERIEENYDQLLHHVKQLMRDRFGSKSERYIDPANPQNSLFDEPSDDAESESDETKSENLGTAPSSDNNVVNIAAHQRCKKIRSDNFKNLPKLKVIIPVDESDRTCGCGQHKELIRYESSEILNYQPAIFEIIEEQREVVACTKGCDDSIQAAPAPKRVLPKVMTTASFLANIIVSKIDDRQPLYHQEQQFKQRYQFHVSRQTLASYFIETAKVLQPIINLAKDELIEYDIASCDATTLQVLKEPGRPAKRKSYVYCTRGGPPNKAVILYECNALLHKSFLSEWFEGFDGYLHVDADPFFEDLPDKNGITLSYCNAHARRKFEPIANATKSDGLARHAMKVYQGLYKIERYAKNHNLSVTERYFLRQKESKPIMDDFKLWLEDAYPTVLAKSPLGKAIEYCINHWDGLAEFLNDGRLEIDNNLTEQQIKPFVIGCKNFMFSCSIAGAKALSVHFSLVRMAKAHNLDPYRYYAAILKALPECATVEDYETLLPWNIRLGGTQDALKKAA